MTRSGPESDTPVVDSFMLSFDKFLWDFLEQDLYFWFLFNQPVIQDLLKVWLCQLGKVPSGDPVCSGASPEKLAG